MASSPSDKDIEKGLQSPQYAASSTINGEGTSSFVQVSEHFSSGLGISIRNQICRPWRYISQRWNPSAIFGRKAPVQMTETIVHKLEDDPKGYPQLARFLNSDESFMVYRRFGCCFSRVLLAKQEEISRMEADLAGMDRQDEDEGNKSYIKSHHKDANRDTIPSTWPCSRKDLLQRLEEKLHQYADLLVKARQLKTFDCPTSRDYRSVLNFMELDGGPLYRQESKFIYEKEDLITIRPDRENAWLDGMLERFLRVSRCKFIIYLFCSKDTMAKTSDADIHYYDRTRIRMCVTMVVTFAVLALLVLPVWLLYKLSVKGTITSNPDAFCILIIFTLALTGGLSAFTKAKRHEIVAASAAYCAVLVVFLGNVKGNGP